MTGRGWSKPAKLITGFSIPRLGKPIAWHPTILWDDAGGASGAGWLYYAYSPSWGHRDPHVPHYLVGRPVAFSIVGVK